MRIRCPCLSVLANSFNVRGPDTLLQIPVIRYYVYIIQVSALNIHFLLHYSLTLVGLLSPLRIYCLVISPSNICTIIEYPLFGSYIFLCNDDGCDEVCLYFYHLFILDTDFYIRPGSIRSLQSAIIVVRTRKI